MKRWIFLLTAALILVHPCYSSAAPADRGASRAKRQESKAIRQSRRADRNHRHAPDAVSRMRPDRPAPSATALSKTGRPSDYQAYNHFPFMREGEYYTEAFAFSRGEKIFVVYLSSGQDTLFMSGSENGGLDWHDPMFVAKVDASSLTGLKTSDGTVLAVWREHGLENTLYMCRFSPVPPVWSDPAPIGETADLYAPCLSQTDDGRLWLSYYREAESGSYETVIRTSDDRGASWSAGRVFTSNGTDPYNLSVVSSGAGAVTAIYACFPDEDDDIYRSTSTDGGITWSTPVPIFNSTANEYGPFVMRESNGVLWMFYSRDEGPWEDYDYWPADVFYVKSFNNGETWTPPNQCTSYAGSDFIEAGCMVEDKPFIVVCSDRWYYQFNLWYALDLITEDSNTPPAFIAWDWSRVVRQGAPVLFNAAVDDESGVAEVGLGIWRGDGYEGDTPMADDGLHEDRAAGDKVWGCSAGPFNAGEWLYVFCYATDYDGNTAYSDGRWLYVPIVHDAGEVVLELFRDSTFGNADDETVSAYRPEPDGQGYLSRGSLWVAGRVDGEKRVMDRDWIEWDWAESEDTGVFLGPGESDQDCDMVYDDRWASTAPIGLQVRQKSFQWSESGRDDFIVFRYTVRRLSAVGSTPELYAGFFADADVPWSDWRNNLTGFDAERNMLYAYNASGNPGTYVGVRFLDGGAALHSANGFLAAAEPETDEARFDLMAAGGVVLPADTGDCRLLVTAPAFSPATGDSFTVAYGLVLGNGLAELKANADTMAALYGRIPSGVNGRDAGVSVPFRFALFQNHPNPFNPSTSIGFRLPVSGPVTVKVYDITGREAAVLSDRFFSSGSHRLEWNASGIGSGVYFCRIQAGEFTAVRKMVLMK